jgi:TrmH family RNA methyltransferase
MLSKSQLKYIQSLGQKKLRDEANLFIAEGPKIVSELLNEPNCKITHIYALANWITGNGKANAEMTEISSIELEKISQLTEPNQVLALVEKVKLDGEPNLHKNISLLLDNIQDPGNMGTILRIADWFGVQHIFCSYDCVDIYNTKVVQASMGSIVRVRTEYTDLVNFLKRNSNKKSYAATLDGTDIRKIEKPGKGLLIIGNESRGISEEILRISDERITIPAKGKAESLNAGVATGILLSYLCQ